MQYSIKYYIKLLNKINGKNLELNLEYNKIIYIN